MSKIGRVNLELQEQANELGFSTVQGALDNGYEVVQRTMGAPRDLDEIDREPEVWYELRKKDGLQRQAEELGFSTVQEALDNGYVVGTDLLGGTTRLIKPIDMQKALEEAHKAWLKEKEEVLEGLCSVYNDIDVPLDDKKFIKQAIEFIKRGEV